MYLETSAASQPSAARSDGFFAHRAIGKKTLASWHSTQTRSICHEDAEIT